jgi:hypothetical protein
MATPIILSTGSSSGAGTADQGRNDLVIGETVALSDTEALNLGGSYVWVFEDTPIGSSVGMINSTTATPSFIPDVNGSYRVRCTVGGSDFSVEVLAVPLPNSGGRIPSFEEELEYDAAGNTKGWHYSMTEWMRAVDTSLISTLQSAYDASAALAGTAVILSPNGAVDIQRNGIDSNFPSSPLVLRNITPATALEPQQWSPALGFWGTAWDGSVSVTTVWSIMAEPIDGVATSVDLIFSAIPDGGVPAEVGRLTSAGALEFPSAVLAANTASGGDLLVVGNAAAPVSANNALTVYHDRGELVDGLIYAGVNTKHTGSKTAAGDFLGGVTGVFGIGNMGADNIRDWSIASLPTLSGVQASVTMDNPAVPVIIASAASFAANNAYPPGNVTITSLHGLWVQAQTGGTNNYGVYVQEPSGGTINDAIHVVGGRSYFGGNVEAAGNISIDSTAGLFLNGSGGSMQIHQDAGFIAFAIGANQMTLGTASLDLKMAASATVPRLSFTGGGGIGAPATGEVAVITASLTAARWDSAQNQINTGTVEAPLLWLGERAAALANVAGKGQIWVDNNVAQTAYFTDDAGVDFPIGGDLAPGAYTHPNHSGDVTSVADGATTITAGVVTNAKLANMANQTFKGRTTAGPGGPEDLTATQATAMLDNFTSTLKGLVPLSGGGTTNFLRADGTWVAPPGAGGGNTLDAAYDQGGAGAGRTVTVDTGAVDLQIDAIGATADAALILSNNTVAADGAQQFSPTLEFVGSGWKTDATASSQQVKLHQQLVTIQGAPSPAGALITAVSIENVSAGAYTTIHAINSEGQNLAVDGSVGDPSWSFLDHGTVGLYYEATDTLSITTDSTKRAEFDDTGRFRIVSNGTAATPSFASTGAPTGLYWDTLALGLSTNGSEHLLLTTVSATAKNAVFTGQVGSPQATLTSGATISTDCNLGNSFTLPLAEVGATMSNPTNAIAGFTYLWRIVQTTSTTRTITTWGTEFHFPGGTAPTLSTGIGDVDVVTGYYDGTNFLCTFQADFRTT